MDKGGRGVPRPHTGLHHHDMTRLTVEFSVRSLHACPQHTAGKPAGHYGNITDFLLARLLLFNPAGTLQDSRRDVDHLCILG